MAETEWIDETTMLVVFDKHWGALLQGRQILHELAELRVRATIRWVATSELAVEFQPQVTSLEQERAVRMIFELLVVRRFATELFEEKYHVVVP